MISRPSRYAPELTARLDLARSLGLLTRIWNGLTRHYTTGDPFASAHPVRSWRASPWTGEGTSRAAYSTTGARTADKTGLFSSAEDRGSLSRRSDEDHMRERCERTRLSRRDDP
jgi:hypothetical protein